jgi:hypothetical protein
MDVAWMRSLVEQFQAAKAPVFVKQFGARPFRKCDDCTCADGEVVYAHPVRSNPMGCASGVLLKNRKGADLSEIPGEWPREFPPRTA